MGGTDIEIRTSACAPEHSACRLNPGQLRSRTSHTYHHHQHHRRRWRQRKPYTSSGGDDSDGVGDGGGGTSSCAYIILHSQHLGACVGDCGEHAHAHADARRPPPPPPPPPSDQISRAVQRAWRRRRRHPSSSAPQTANRFALARIARGD